MGAKLNTWPVLLLLTSLQLANAASSQIGFHARLKPSTNPQLTKGQIVKFDLVLVNIGSSYDAARGIFTAPMDGMYAFQFSSMSPAGDSQVNLLLKVKDAESVFIHTKSETGTGHGVFHLNRNDKVWVESNFGNNTLYSFGTTFTGFLVTPDDADRLETSVTGLMWKTAQQAVQIATLQTQIQQLQDAASRQIGFHARLQPTSNPQVNPGQIVKFDLVLVNVGSSYNSTSGIFTAPVDGLYAFQFSSMSPACDTQVSLLLKVKDAESVYIHTKSQTGTGHGVFHLNRNDKVWVESNGLFPANTLYSYSTTFTGFLVTRDF